MVTEAVRPMFYLAYGSNLHPGRLIERLGPVECLGRVRLPGWRLVFDKRGSDGSAKANLRACPGTVHEAWGAVFELQPAQYSMLDHFEGAGRGYDSFVLDLKLEGQTIEVVTYLTPGHWRSESARPWSWYRDLVLAGARYHRFPSSIIKALQQLPTLEDPDPERVRIHHRLLDGLH